MLLVNREEEGYEERIPLQPPNPLGTLLIFFSQRLPSSTEKRQKLRAFICIFLFLFYFLGLFHVIIIYYPIYNLFTFFYPFLLMLVTLFFFFIFFTIFFSFLFFNTITIEAY